MWSSLVPSFCNCCWSIEHIRKSKHGTCFWILEIFDCSSSRGFGNFWIWNWSFCWPEDPDLESTIVMFWKRYILGVHNSWMVLLFESPQCIGHNVVLRASHVCIKDLFLGPTDPNILILTPLVIPSWISSVIIYAGSM